ncbi:hypothetical protein PT974_05147 [Cladobotryum mycophilum]|uniref:Uncharacterized protein n=1 Tax=Cladobotryum mycophilum TaxID=491253 RepID=A0ABR0SR60_9HYPO
MKSSLISTFSLLASPLLLVNASPYKRDLTYYNYGEIRVAVTPKYKHVYGAWNTGAKAKLGIWYPTADDSFRPLSVVAVKSHEGINDKHGTMPLVDSSMPALKEPTDWTKVWANYGSNSSYWLAYWRPTPPDGYACVGDFVTAAFDTSGRSKPDTNKIWCVRKDLAREGTYAAKPFWRNDGAKGEEDFSIWENSAEPENVKGSEFVTLYTGGQMAGKAYNQPDTECWLLAVNLPNKFVEFDDPHPEVSLTRLPPVGKVFKMTSQANITMPITSLFDSGSELIARYIKYPFFTIFRSSAWYVVDVVDNRHGSGEQVWNKTVTSGISREVSNSLEVSTGVTFTAEFGFGANKAGVSLNYQLTSTVTQSLEEFKTQSIGQEVHVPVGNVSVIFARTDSIKILRFDGRMVKERSITANRAVVPVSPPASKDEVL